MVAAVVVRDCCCRRVRSFPRFASESHRSADDFLATAPVAAGSASQHFFCDVLLPRQRWRIFEPGVAVECWSCYPGV